jgi:hypothetical protein
MAGTVVDANAYRYHTEGVLLMGISGIGTGLTRIQKAFRKTSGGHHGCETLIHVVREEAKNINFFKRRIDYIFVHFRLRVLGRGVAHMVFSIYVEQLIII